jgi:tetratricopeptide (TPR) repeat protein
MYGLPTIQHWILTEQWEVNRIQRLVQKKSFSAAVPLLRKRIERLKRTDRESHLESAVAKFTLGEIEYQTGRRDIGKGLLDQATAVFDAYQGPEDDAFLVHLNDLAAAQSRTDSPDQAIETYARCLNIERRRAGADTNLAHAVNKLAGALKRAGRMREALPLYQECEELHRLVCGPVSVEVARANTSLSECLIALERWDEAEHHVRLALFILDPSPSVELAEACNTYGRLLERRQDWAGAEEMRAKSLVTFEHCAESNSVRFAEELERLANVLQRLQRDTECRVYHQKAAAIRKALV